MFAERYGNSYSSGFNWGNTESSTWVHGIAEKSEFNCEAHHRCILKQLVGKCGNIEFYTSKIILESIPLKPPNQVIIDGHPHSFTHVGFTTKDEEDEGVDSDESQTWVAVEISEESEGEWGRPARCPPGSFVLADQQTLIGGQLTAVTLQCSAMKAGVYTGVDIISSSESHGRKSEIHSSQEPAVGFSYRKYSHKGLVHDSYQFVYPGDTNDLSSDENEDYVHEKEVCSPNRAVCGIRTKMDENLRKFTFL